nr:hypothetical protein [Tanacetum cinerariifolium]
PKHMCDVPSHDNSPPLDVSTDQIEDFFESNEEFSSIDDDSFSIDDIDYVEASPPDSELVSSEVMEIVIPEVGGIDDDILLTIEHDVLREKLLNVNLLIAKIEALNANPTPSSDCKTKYSSKFPKSCPPTDRSDFTHEEFTDELAHIISPLEYDCFYFRDLPDPGEWISSLNFGICENLSSTTCVNFPVEDDHSPLLAYVVWIFLAYLTYLVIPPHLHSFGIEDTIFDPCITINLFYSFKPGLSHRYGTIKKFNTHRSHLNKCSMMIHGQNTPPLDVLLFCFYPP